MSPRFNALFRRALEAIFRRVRMPGHSFYGLVAERRYFSSSRMRNPAKLVATRGLIETTARETDTRERLADPKPTVARALAVVRAAK